MKLKKMMATLLVLGIAAAGTAYASGNRVQSTGDLQGIQTPDISNHLLARGGGGGGNGPGDGTGNDGDGPADGTGNGETTDCENG